MPVAPPATPVRFPASPGPFPRRPHRDRQRSTAWGTGARAAEEARVTLRRVSPPHRTRWLLLGFCALAWAPVATLGFVWDDFGLLVKHPRLGDPAALPELLVHDLWWHTGIVAPPYYRPLVVLSFAVDRLVFGLSPALAHLHSLAWHLLAVALVHTLLERLRPGLPALAGAALFALHPLQSEAVAFVAARNDPMAVALAVGALLLAWPADARAARLAAAAGLAAAALLAKESTVILPLLLVLLDFGAHGRPGPWRRPAALLAGLVGVVLLRLALPLPGFDRLPSHEEIAILLDRLPVVLSLLGQLLVLPWPLVTGRHLTYLDPPVVAIVGGLAALGAGVGLLLRHGGRLAAAGLLVATGGLLPNALPLASTGRVGERFVYLPMLGVAVGLAAAWPARGGRVALGLLVAYAVALLEVRLPDWRSDESRLLADARHHPTPYTHWAYGKLLLNQGAPDRALGPLVASVLDPDHAHRWGSSCRDAQEAAVRTGRWDVGQRLVDEAVGCTDRSGELGAWEAVSLAMGGRWPEVEARVADPNRPLPEIWRPAAAAAALARGDDAAAAAHRQAALAAGMDPAHFDERVESIRATAP